MRPHRSLLVALAATASASCFSEAPPAPPPVAPMTATVEAGASTNTFTPSTVTIKRGGTVTWTIGARRHNVQFFAAAGAPTNIAAATNVTESRQFPTAGSFPYNCSLHAGMVGSVVVQP